MSSSESETSDRPYVGRSRRVLPTPPRRRQRISSSSSSIGSDQVKKLTSTLRDADKNLYSVDHMLNSYRGSSNQQMSAINRLRDSLVKTTNQLRDERLAAAEARGSRGPMRTSDLDEDHEQRTYQPTSPLKEYKTSGSYSRSNYRRHRKRPSVRFEDDLEEIHEIHQAVRDLSSDQLRLGRDLNQEVQRRLQNESDNRRSLQNLASSLKQSQREETSSDRVEKRLQDIQDELRQERLRKEHKERPRSRGLGDAMSLELREAIHTQRSIRKEDDNEASKRLLQTESQRQKLGQELDETKQKLNQTHGVNTALKSQIDSLQSQLDKADKERGHLSTKLRSFMEAAEEESQRSMRSRRNIGEEVGKESYDRLRMEKEIDKLRLELAQTSGAKDSEESRRELKKTQRQRDQLADNLETFSRELDAKEKHQKKILAQLNDVSERYNDSERQRMVVLTQFEELQSRLREVMRERDANNEKIKESERLLEQSEKRREDIKTHAQEAIRQWKNKSKSLERESNQFKYSTGQISQRNESLVKENEGLKTQYTTATQRMENLHREMNTILEKRAEQDEQVRLKDIRISELTSVQLDLDRELKETRSFLDKLDGELQTQQARQSALTEEKMRLEDELINIRSDFSQAQKQISRQNVEIRELSIQKAEYGAKLSEQLSKCRELEGKIRSVKHEEEMAKEELATRTQQFKEECSVDADNIKTLQQDLQDAKNHEERRIQELVMKMRKDRANTDAEIQALKIELTEEQAISKSAKKQLEKSRLSNDELTEKLTKAEEENNQLKMHYDRIRQRYEEQTQLAELEENRLTKLERHYQVLQDRARNQSVDYDSVLNSIGNDIDTLVQVLSKEDNDPYATIQSPKKNFKYQPQKWLTSYRNKLHWVQHEMKQQLKEGKRLKQDLNHSRGNIEEAVKTLHEEKEVFISEMDQHAKAVDKLRLERTQLELDNLRKTKMMNSLEKQVISLETHIEMNANALRRSTEILPERDSEALKPLAEDENSNIQVLQSKCNRINERYQKYRSTVDSLQEQLEHAKLSAQQHKFSMESSEHAAQLASLSPPTRKRRVQINNSPPVRYDASPMHQDFDNSLTQLRPLTGRSKSSLKSTGGHHYQYTPEPLDMSDGEFVKRFIPATP
ncbi:centrosomal protein of 128 kDa-like [Anneissia japonica]|uniref:centrosomal protein of 128 kDa-like n=1 Tax=Anneissia japonica TaxID=1529436 RepID=UPI0014259A5A|nr:centrosomal protein of 128 kDa-like [Anneissia japonica]XP_033114943.1 centrosomal protein of 128 kDa-like [Anneissia japonica]